MHVSVSAVIPAYNAEKFLAITIESALAQTYSLTEIIVVDDGSADGTAEAAARFPNTRVIRRVNGGQAAARNTGIRAATGEWIAFLDHDDTWKPQKTQIQLRYASPGVGVIHGNEFEKVDFESLWRRKAFITPSGALVRKQALEEVGGFEESRSVMGVEDLNLWLRLALTKWQFVKSEPGLFHWNSVDNQSADDVKMLDAELANAEQIGALANRSRESIDYLKRRIRLEYARNLIGAGRFPIARDLLDECDGGFACGWLRLAANPGLKRLARKDLLNRILGLESWPQ